MTHHQPEHQHQPRAAERQHWPLLVRACQGLPLTPHQLRAAMSRDDLKDWLKGVMDQNTATALARLVAKTKDREQTEITTETDHNQTHEVSP